MEAFEKAKVVAENYDWVVSDVELWKK